MKLDVGTEVVFVMAVLFFIRFIGLRRGNSRLSAGMEIDPQSTRPRPAVRFSNAYLVALGIVLLVVGAFLNVAAGLPPDLQAAWWAPSALGLLLLALIIR